MSMGVCEFCNKAFDYNSKKRKNAKFCNMVCYTSFMKLTSMAPKEIVNPIIQEDTMNEKEWAQNIALAIAMVIVLIIIVKLFI